MKKWIIATLAVILVISIGFNVVEIRKDRQLTNYILSRYKEELLRCADAFQESVTDSNKRGFTLNLLTSGQAANVAFELAYTLGRHDSTYSFSENGKVYDIIAREMSYITIGASSADISGDKRQRMNDILQEYVNQLKSVDVGNPAKLREVYYDVHREIDKRNLNQDHILPPQSDVQ